MIFAAAWGVLGSDQVSDGKATPTAVAKESKKIPNLPTQNEGNAVLTGSYIKREIRRNGQITDGPNQVIVIDRATIEGSGASDLKQLLVHQGIH